VPMLRSPVGRARGWVRQALNTKQLAHCLKVLLQQGRYVQAFWKAHALIRCPEWSGPAGLLVPMLESLDQFDFLVGVEQDDLNHKGVWTILDNEPLSDQQAPALPPPPPPPSSSSSGGSGGGSGGGGGGWVPPRDKWGGGASSGGGGGGSNKPQWMSALEGKLFGDEEKAAEWKAKAKTSLDWGLNALGTKFDQVATAAGKTMEEFAETPPGEGGVVGSILGGGGGGGGGGRPRGGSSGSAGAEQQRGGGVSSSALSAAAAGSGGARRGAGGSSSSGGGGGSGGGGNTVYRKAPPRGLWGVSLSRLARLETHCSLAFLSPAAALPDALSAMMGALDESILTPGLFRRPVSGAALEAVRTYFDKNPRVRYCLKYCCCCCCCFVTIICMRLFAFQAPRRWEKKLT
jgi:hypothetical protein